MAEGISIQQVEVEETKPDLKTLLAEYVEGRSATTRAMHKWMNYLTMVSVAIPSGLFVLALYLSITWKIAGGIQVTVAWFAFAASAMLFAFINGLHAILLRAFPPIPAIGSKFVTGKNAVWAGVGLMAVALLVAAFWGIFAYVVWTRNMTMVKVMVNILANVVGIGAVIAILFSLYREFRRKL